MLVITRKALQGLTIGKAGDVLKEPIKIRVLGRDRGQVRLGIAADPEVVIVRDELIGTPPKPKED